jgi:hypothetical protein
MTNDERSPKSKISSVQNGRLMEFWILVIRHSDFFRHSSFVIRISRRMSAITIIEGLLIRIIEGRMVA